MKVVEAYQDDNGNMHQNRESAVRADFHNDVYSAFNGVSHQVEQLSDVVSLLMLRADIRAALCGAITRFEAAMVEPQSR